MATEIRVPTLGESVSEATIGKWFKKAGDAVKADEPLLELETDKVTLEVNAPAAGVLAEITVKDGETVTPGALLGQISEGAGAAASSAKSQAKVKAAAPPPASVPTQAPAGSRAAAAATNGGSQTQAAPTQMRPAPSAAKIAAERGIDTGEIAGSGKRGQVLKGDVLAFSPASAPAPAREPSPVQARAPSPP
ncbi:MAG: hypothetical protein QOF41_74, partial [Methylobacteriaceae bacterium]|nr:hypothetical protein [Methylobacteriaceae bacterium]